MALTTTSIVIANNGLRFLAAVNQRRGMMLKGTIFGLLIYVLSINSSFGQFDPRPSLLSIINAFQNCGPPQAYQILSPQLFQAIAMQTNGKGCYPAIRQAGPITSMQMLQSQDFPIGPLFMIRVQHPQAVADWYIGFNRMNGRIEYLNFQPAQGSAIPDIGRPPTGPIPHPTPTPGTTPGPAPGPDASEGCRAYPAMCAN